MSSIEAAIDTALYKGHFEGLQEGIELGKQEGKWEMAESMFKDGQDIASISKWTVIGIKELNKKFRR